MQYQAGDRVRIVDQWASDGSCRENPNGCMDHWLGQVMTIDRVNESTYRMVEDIGERLDGRGWFWNEHCIAGFADEPLIADIADGTEMESFINLIG